MSNKNIKNNKKGSNKNNNNKQPQQLPQFRFVREITSLVLIFILGIWFFSTLSGLYQKPTLDYNRFFSLVEDNRDNLMISSIKKTENLMQVEFTDQAKTQLNLPGTVVTVYIPEEDTELIPLIRKNVDQFIIEPPKAWPAVVTYILPWVLFIGFLWFLSSRGSQMGSRVFSFGKTKARMLEKGKTPPVTFQDVAGIDEAKEELKEVILFLKDPKRFQRLGGRIPKGVILVGPPGCGKTLLAKAVAGEADAPFFSISGSDFVEMFVGVGASRVRDLFEQSKKASKLMGKGGIIFIDEIDAVGRQRFAGVGGGHDEREQTLNQLLVEMDGFQTEEGIIVIAATNRPDVLDPALLRPGRFDRHIVIDAPDIKGREEILKVHTRKIKLNEKISLSTIARQTPGFSGADLENLCNEGALLAARKDKDSVGMDELQEAMERVVAGPQRKSKVISKKEKKIIAYHESGHAMLSLYMKNVDPLHKVSIIPRGVGALGYTMQLPEYDRYIHSKTELLDRLCVFLGGRAAEDLVLGDITSGAQNDLEQATVLARKMVTELGMSYKLGNLTYGKKQGPLFLGRDLVEHKDYSDETARLIDEEVKELVESAYARTKKVLSEHIEKLKKLAEVLLEKEVLDSEEVKEIVGFKGKNTQDESNSSPNT